MHIGNGFRVILSVAIVTAAASFAYINFNPRGFPVTAQQIDNYTIVLHARPGMPMPPGGQDGDRIDFRKMDFFTRVDTLIPNLPLGFEIHVPVERGRTTQIMSTKVVSFRGLQTPGQPSLVWFQWPGLGANLLLGGIALLLLWRGRDRAAFGMALWAITFLFSVGITAIPLAGWPALAALYLAPVCFLIARVGFYIMIEARLGPALNVAQRTAFRATFIILLAFGALQALGAPAMRMATGSNEFQTPEYGLILTASYLVPIVMLFVGYRPATAAERLRLRWMLVSGLAWTGNIFLQNSPLLGGPISGLLSTFLQAVALLGFLYAVLRLRVVDISVVIDRALVYGLVTTLVVGIIAAVNSIALHETLTPGAGLAIQVLVPLALGIVLGRVRSIVDKLVEQLFFRKRYLAEKALKTFARHAGHIESTDKLLNTTVQMIKRHVRAPAVVIYVAEAGGVYRCINQSGESFPNMLDKDDPVLVALRADDEAADLADFPGALGEDGCVFPMTVLGTLRGAIVCKNRPGEHYAAHEKQLLTEVARSVGAALRILHARDNEALVAAMAEGKLPAESLCEKARTLMLASGSAHP
ncbi:MAG: GAF domain-containing protein [Gammaproteobacteria bacterium]